MPDILVDRPLYSVDDTGSIVSSTLHIDDQDYQVRYKASSGPVSQRSDTYLVAGLFPAMKFGSDLRIEGSVSPKLLRATGTIQDIITAWFPGYTSISIYAESSNHSGLTDQRGVGAFFSGGMDAFYTLLKHQDEITTLIFIHGFDIQLEKHEFRERASGAFKEVAAAFNKTLVEVETNLAESLERMSPSFIPAGGDAHGAVLASVALLLSAQLKKVYIPSSYPYSNLNPWGSHVLLDPLWSTEDVEIVHDGCEATRVQKAALVAQSDVALRNLRVCLFKPEEGLNCGVCEKCLRCMVTLRAVGALDRCATFHRRLDLKELEKVEIPNQGLFKSYQSTLQAVEENDTDPELAKALRKCIQNYEFNKLAKGLNDEMAPFFESSIGQRLLKSRKNTIMKYLWHADASWMLKEVSRESLKLADRRLLGGVINKLRNMHG
ncbi:MAG: hypothetical protein HY758_03585 [Nitrospirae bacterium]|nr:hypothetical protein [Nitrospirota bacterium]